MTEFGTQTASVEAAPAAETSQGAAPPSRRWVRWAVPLVALAVGFAGGAAIVVASSDPTGSEEYQALEAELEGVRADQESVEADAQQVYRNAKDLEDQVAVRESGVDKRAADLDQQARDVKAREDAVAAIEQRIVQTSIGEGIWTVGVDVEPGTYRTAEPLTGYCYWAILKSGTNGGDIIENDGPEGGVPTVTLSPGQDFENSGCGTFVRQ
ncbi:hypothetical protein [Blastococcus mobilis]|uniref:Uncharacterized protein n=1 Tax=Blastococcus mobilis TaxID=1938746 RepID=A0A239AUB3_9ACTN|nr:hypothetical protein [Blastococcus mobilis]SNR98563.1 hypothetical protein SAMN06272737_1563 [Blastococcus mobilis]